MKTILILFLCILGLDIGCSSSNKSQDDFQYYVVYGIDNLTFSKNAIITLKGMDNEQYIVITDKYNNDNKSPGFVIFDTLSLRKIIKVKLFKYEKKPKLEIRGNLSHQYFIEDQLFWDNGIIKTEVYYSPNIKSIFYEL